jgi:hypothetical protein
MWVVAPLCVSTSEYVFDVRNAYELPDSPVDVLPEMSVVLALSRLTTALYWPLRTGLR